MNLPVIAQVPDEPFEPGATDGMGAAVDAWGTSGNVGTHGWWPPSVEQILGQEPQRRAIEIALALLIPNGTVCADKDRWTIGAEPLLQVGDPQDFNHGPWGMEVPLIVYLKRSEG